MDYQKLSLRQIYYEAEVIAHDAQSHFGYMNSQQLNWKPSAYSWSIAQCLDHLISINGAFYPTFNRILKGEHKRALRHRLPFLPAMFGRMMVKALSPNSQLKFKASDATQPSSSSINPQIVDR